MKAVNETKRFNDSWAKRMAYDSYMDKVRWNNALKEEAEAQCKQEAGKILGIDPGDISRITTKA